MQKVDIVLSIQKMPVVYTLSNIVKDLEVLCLQCIFFVHYLSSYTKCRCTPEIFDDMQIHFNMNLLPQPGYFKNYSSVVLI